MNGKALWVVLEAKPGKEAEVDRAVHIRYF